MNRIVDLLETDIHFECLRCQEIFENEDCAAVVDHDETLCLRCADRVMAEAEDQMERSYER